MSFSRFSTPLLAAALCLGLAASAVALPRNNNRAANNRRNGVLRIPAPADPAESTPAPAIQYPESAAQVADAAKKIDSAVLAGLTKAGQRPNAPATDEQLVRRLYLDIAGRIPTAAETSAFLADPAPDKRAQLIDRLLGSDGYNSQMFNYFGDMLRVEDDYGKGVKTYVYEEWIKEQIAANRPWNELVHDLLTADGKLSNDGPVGYLLRDKAMPLDSLSNTLTIFLGANVACAQCHNHPLAAWTQKDFYQMAAYFGAIDTNYAKAQKLAKSISGKSKKGADAQRQLIVKVLAPNTAAIKELNKNATVFPKEYKYDNAKPGAPVEPKLISWKSADQNSPAATDAPAAAVPLDQLRTTFADWLTSAENPRFAAAIANRLWKRVFGLAVQEPITDLDDLNKASNPELLAELSSEMKRVRFDLREFQRIVFNSRAYQSQVSSTPDPAKGPWLFAGPLLRRMTAEQTWDSVLTLVIGPQVDHYKLERADDIRKLNITAPEVNATTVMAKVDELTQDGPLKKRGGAGGGNGKKGNPEPSLDDYEGTPPPRFEGMTLARASELPQPAREAHFLRMFGQSDRQLADGNSTEGGVPQVLMMMNGDVQSVIANPAASVLKSAANQTGPEKQAESLYISFLGRRPTLQESQTAVSALNSGLQLADLTWILFNSREFIFIQ